MSGWFPAPASRILAITSSVSTTMPDESLHLSVAKSRFSSPVLPISSKPMFTADSWNSRRTQATWWKRMPYLLQSSRRGDGHADLSYIYGAVQQIAPRLSRTATVITKSTVPVGTGDEIERILREKRPDADMQVVSNPEFLREGAAI